MTEKSWLDNRETTREYLNALVQHPWTVEDNLQAINVLRAQSGDQPLTLERYLKNRENLKRGIYSWDEPIPRSFFQRLRSALKKGRAAFHQAMQKN